MQLDDAFAIARSALEVFGLDPEARIDFVKYRENHVFRVHGGADGDVAMRLYRPGYRDDDEALTELTYVRALADAGVPVPEIVPTTTGALFAVVAVAGVERRVSVQRWIADATPFGDIESALAGRHSPDPEEFALIGGVLGRMHAAAVAIGRPEGFRRAAWDADGLVGSAPLWGDPRALRSLSEGDREVIGRALPMLHARLDALGSGRELYGVVHADATPENVMRTPAGYALIDFDDFGEGWYAFDLVTTLFHHVHHPRFPEYEAALRAGYTAVRPLGESELAAWDALLLARGLTYLGWAGQRPGDPASDFISHAVAPWVVDAAAALAAGRSAPWRSASTVSEETP